LLELGLNASSPGEIEVLVRPSNRQELAFKLRTSERPFALTSLARRIRSPFVASGHEPTLHERTMSDSC